MLNTLSYIKDVVVYNIIKNRRCRGSNPGHPRDRREYLPLYYNDFVADDTTQKLDISWMYVNRKGMRSTLNEVVGK